MHSLSTGSETLPLLSPPRFQPPGRLISNYLPPVLDLAGPTNRSINATPRRSTQQCNIRGKSVYTERYVGVIYGPLRPSNIGSTGDACAFLFRIAYQIILPKAPRHRSQRPGSSQPITCTKSACISKGNHLKFKFMDRQKKPSRCRNCDEGAKSGQNQR